MEYVLRTKELKKSYGKFRALNGINMNVPKGAIYGFVGRNGAGKTTLLRQICGLQNPDSGEYSLWGKSNVGRDIVSMRKRMGAVIETPSIYLGMTARENIRQQFRILGLPEDDSIESVLKLVGLENTGKKLSKDFSLGMRQRLGIAIALAGNPDFLVLDEPINGLDPQGIIEMRELILKLNKEYMITVLISSHILDELARLATHFGFIDSGEIIKEISAGELEESYRKRVSLKVSDINVLSRVLDSLGVEYSVTSENEADVYSEVAVTELVTDLLAEGCRVLSMNEREESLESYYINLVGGGSND